MLKLYLTGVHCADCVNDLVEGILLNLRGVNNATFNDKDLSLNIAFDRNLISEERIKEAVLNVGYNLRNSEKVKGGAERQGIYQGKYNLFIVVLIILALLLLVYWVKSL